MVTLRVKLKGHGDPLVYLGIKIYSDAVYEFRIFTYYKDNMFIYYYSINSGKCIYLGVFGPLFYDIVKFSSGLTREFDILHISENITDNFDDELIKQIKLDIRNTKIKEILL